jgi:VanZ family protein
VEKNWNVAVFGYLVLVAVFIALVISLYYLWSRLKIRSFSNYLWLAAVASVYVIFTLRLWAKPEEAIHFLEYGLLGFLLYQALRHHIHDKGIYFITFLIGALVGIFDESLQWMIPRRVWDFRDLGINALSVGLCLVAIWKGIRPELKAIHAQSKAIRIMSYLLIAYLVLFGLCFSNTPDRVHSYTKALPFLSFLQNEEPMNEFKYVHRDSEIGVFFSRLDIQELNRIDTERAEEYGQIFRDWAEKKYPDFLNYFPGYARPFLHEMRVHVFRRNTKFWDANKSESEKIRKENLFIAYKENQILEKYFGNTLQKSPYQWPQERSEQIRGKIDVKMFYKSPVSAASPIPFKEYTLWLIILFLVLMIVVVNLWIRRKNKRSAWKVP